MTYSTKWSDSNKSLLKRVKSITDFRKTKDLKTEIVI